MNGNQIVIWQRWRFFYVFEFFIRLDFKKGKLKKKSRLKIEKLSAFDIMVIENAISAISVSILRPFLWQKAFDVGKRFLYISDVYELDLM